MENSTPASVPVNVAYFSDGNFLRDLGKLEGKMDALEKRVEKRVEKQDKFADDINAIKEWKAMVIGGSAVVSAICSAVVVWLVK